MVWGEDALFFVNFVPTGLFELQILVPDEFVQAAADHLLRELPQYHVTDDRPQKFIGRHGSEPFLPSAIPNSIQLQWSGDDIDSETDLSTPIEILIIGQSHMMFDVRDSTRTRGLIPPFEESDSQIRFPTQGAFIDALVDSIFTRVGPKLHYWFYIKHDLCYLSYLIVYNVRHDSDEEPLDPDRILLPTEQEMLDGIAPRNRPFVEAYMRGGLPEPTPEMEAERQRIRVSQLS